MFWWHNYWFGYEYRWRKGSRQGFAGRNFGNLSLCILVYHRRIMDGFFNIFKIIQSVNTGEVKWLCFIVFKYITEELWLGPSSPRSSFNGPLRQIRQATSEAQLSLVGLFVSRLHWQFGLIWLCKSPLPFIGSKGNKDCFEKSLPHLTQQLCECGVSIHIKSVCINYHGFKIWEMIHVNSDFIWSH